MNDFVWNRLLRLWRPLRHTSYKVSCNCPPPPPPFPEVCVNKVVIFFIMEATYAFPLLQRLRKTFHHVVYSRGHLHATLHPHAKLIQFNCKSCAHSPLLQKLQVTLHQVYISSGLSEQYLNFFHSWQFCVGASSLHRPKPGEGSQNFSTWNLSTYTVEPR